jgi:signal transduction histidine kinase
MTPLKLTSWLRSRLFPLVLSTAVVVAVSAPCAFYLRQRLDRVEALRADASRVADVLRAEIEARPRLWRYGTGKLSERLSEEGLGRVSVRVLDGDGFAVPLEAGPLPPNAWALWGRAEVSTAGRPAATVWAAADQRPLLGTAFHLFLAFALLAALLGTVLYVMPVRAMAGAERRIELLLSRLALALQQEERRRIARELHDGVGQAITAARLELLAASARAALPPGSAETIGRRLDEALDEVRRSTAMLAPPALAELGLARALERHCTSFGGSAGLNVQCDVEAELPMMDADVEGACYRIVQEALSNAVRHGHATCASVSLKRAGTGAVALDISDDGSGLKDPVGRGQGLEGIRERAKLLGGEVLIESPPGAGVRVRVTLPAQPGEVRA